jgi:hypothetical protein
MKLTWDDIERATIEGIFIVRGKSVWVGQTALDIWRDHPEAVFDTVVPEVGKNREATDLVLAGFTLPGRQQEDVAQTYLRSPASD